MTLLEHFMLGFAFGYALVGGVVNVLAFFVRRNP